MIESHGRWRPGLLHHSIEWVRPREAPMRSEFKMILAGFGAGAVIGVAFDVNSKNILNIFPSIFAVLLVKVFNKKINNFVAIYSKELAKRGLE